MVTPEDEAPRTFPERVAAELRRVRLARGFSQAEVARLLGTTQPAVAQAEGRRANPSAKLLGRIAVALGRRAVFRLAPLGGEKGLDDVPKTRAQMNESLLELWLERRWPTTIVPARYGGSYEGGRWLALACEPHDFPADAHGDDCACAEYFASREARAIGRGGSPEEALADLGRRLREAGLLPAGY